MLSSFWGFRSLPFSDPSGAGFYRSVASNEALARMRYLVDQNYRLGIIVGETGVGKSVLLNFALRQFRSSGMDACLLNVLGMQLDEFLPRLALNLGIYDLPNQHGSMAEIWQAIFDQIQLNSYQRRSTVLLFDDVDEAEPEIRTAIRRLAQSVTHPQHRLTIILGAETVQVRRLTSGLVDLASLRVELWPWTEDEVFDYLQQELQRVGGSNNIFNQAAAQRIAEVSRGVPRRVCRIAELSLAAAAGQNLSQIDEYLVESVADELQLSISAW